MPKLNIVSAINLALDREMGKNDKVVIIGEDVGREGGVFRVTDGLQGKYGPERVIDTPLSEGGIAGTALGLAVGGLVPVAEIQFEGFMYLALDQIANQMARYRSRSRGQYPINLVLRLPWGGGIRAPEHHSDSPEAVLVNTPGITVVQPSNPYDAKGLMTAALRYGDPVIYCEPKRIYRAIKAEVPDEDYEVPIGKANVVREGTDMTIVAWGAMMREALKAAEELAADGVSAEVIDLRTISPMDSDTIVSSVKKTGRLLVTHEAPRTGGIGAEIAARVYEEAFTSLLAPVERVTGYDAVMPLFKLEDYYLPDAKKIIAGARKMMSY